MPRSFFPADRELFVCLILPRGPKRHARCPRPETARSQRGSFSPAGPTRSAYLSVCPAILPPPHGSFFFLSSCAAGHGAPSYRAARNGSLARLRALARGPKRHARSTILFLRQAPPPRPDGNSCVSHPTARPEMARPLLAARHSMPAQLRALACSPKRHARCARSCPLDFIYTLYVCLHAAWILQCKQLQTSMQKAAEAKRRKLPPTSPNHKAL